MAHIEHDYGIDSGIEAQCPQCRTTKLGNLDSNNIVIATGKTWDELQLIFDQLPGLEAIFRNTSALLFMVESGRRW